MCSVMPLFRGLKRVEGLTVRVEEGRVEPHLLRFEPGRQTDSGSGREDWRRTFGGLRG